MKVRIVAFASLRDRLGFRERDLEVAAGSTAGGVAETVLGSPLPRGVALARNQERVGPGEPLADGDELALLPPVSGGAPLLRIQAEPISIDAVLAEVRDPRAGAVLLFLGTARELEGERLVKLEYEAYPEMAERFFAGIADEVRKAHGVERIAIVHRTGAVAVGEPSVAIAVASPHRAEGFAALRHAIERIKEEAPIWKQEVSEKAARWVGSEGME